MTIFVKKLINARYKVISKTSAKKQFIIKNVGIIIIMVVVAQHKIFGF